MSIEVATDRAPLTQRESDRRFYPFMALLFLAAAAIGFGPNSFAILTGAMENPPLTAHIHAATMASWLMLLVAQTSLMASGRARLHQRLGLVSLVLAPAMVLSAATSSC